MLFAQSDAFQPSPPYHATFFYPWYPQWTDGGHTPPRNWFSNYLPDPDPCVFDPAAELYRSTDDRILDWQLRKMAEARLEVAIASWWGRGHRTDGAIRYILTDFMDRADNPYPNLRWAIYYELESQGDPPVEKLVDDLLYIRDHYAGRRSYLRIAGRPVIFVYSEGRDTSDLAARWAEARRRTGFYTVLKVFSGYRTDPNQPDSWHQYAPANRIDKQSPYSWAVSPGFWLDGQAVRLPRDVDAFREAVVSMVAADVPWKFIQTWNEWGEGTSVEPGDPVIQTTTGAAAQDPDAPWFKNRYIEVLRETLPPLEQGTGAVDTAPVFDRGAVLNGASLQAGSIAPDQVLTVFGARFTPDARVSFNCIPAQVVFSSASQINVIVPADVAASRFAELRIDSSWPVTLPVAAAAPGLFTTDSSGKGQAQALNEDGTVNSVDVRAAAGSLVTLFATGVAVGSVAATVAGLPATDVAALSGGTAGVVRVIVRIPSAAATGDAVPVVLNSAGVPSQSGVTIAVGPP